MRFTTILLGATMLAAAGPAFAQDQTAQPSALNTSSAVSTSDQTAPPSAITVTGSASILTDYRLRGVSQTNKNAAVQASLTIAHKSGFYLGTFASNLAGWGTFGGANIELDAIGGYKHSFGGTTVDGGVTWYTYPGGASESDVVEFYLKASHTLGPVSATAGVAYAPTQTSLGRFYRNAAQYIAGTTDNPKRWDNLYLTLDGTVAIPHTPVTAKGHVGYSKGNPGLGPNGTSLAPTGQYVDWALGADIAVYKNFTVNLSYIDTDISQRESAYLAPNFRKSGTDQSISDPTFLASLTASF